jgi:hypothetical protein
MLIPFGVLSAAGAGGVAGDYELIETTILGSASSEVLFSSLATYASDYKHLQIRYTARSTRAAVADNLGVRFNGVTTTSYSHHRLYGNGTNVQSFAGTSATFMLGDGTTGNTSTASAFSAGVIDILDSYSTTKNKTIRILSGYTVSGDHAIELTSGAFYNTAALTSVSVFALTGNLVAGTRMSLYGIKG